VFFLINQYEKGLEYDLRSIPYHIETGNDEMLAYAYTYVASDFMRLQKHDSAKRYFEIADPIVTKLNKNSVNIEYYGKIAEMFWWQKMPEMLTRFGLDEALKEYCSSVTATKLLSVKYQSHGMEKRLDTSTEIIVYRIVQELLNNILKHAALLKPLFN
jgi:hypothetical protein